MVTRMIHDSNIAETLFVSTKTGVAFRVVLKCGCTYLKNLLWHFDHDVPHPLGNAIHKRDRDLPRSIGQSIEDVRRNPYAFIVLRDPVERFLSLYFDKVVRAGEGRFQVLRDAVANEPGFIPDARTPDAHRQNCFVTLAWVRANLARETPQAPNPHWNRQMVTVRSSLPLGLKVLTLNGLDSQLRFLLSDHVPDLERHLAGAKWRNRAPRLFSSADILNDELVAEIIRLYRRDAANWTKADAMWRDIDRRASDLDAIPRLGRDIADDRDRD